jgi:hypothetical protein
MDHGRDDDRFAVSVLAALGWWIARPWALAVVTVLPQFEEANVIAWD